MRRRYKYLGKSVRDIRKKGLDAVKEYEGILRQILRQARKGSVPRKVLRGRLLLLYRLTFKKNNSKIRYVSMRRLLALRRKIKEAMSKI